MQQLPSGALHWTAPSGSLEVAPAPPHKTDAVTLDYALNALRDEAVLWGPLPDQPRGAYGYAGPTRKYNSNIQQMSDASRHD